MKRSILFLCCACLIGNVFAQNKPKGNVQNNSYSQSRLTCANFDRNTYYYEDIALKSVVSSALNSLRNLPADAYYDSSSQKENVRQMLEAVHVKFTDSELSNLTQVKSIQMNSRGIYEYAYFKCKFEQRGNSVYYRKTSGSQRQNGYLYRLDEKTIYFLGAWSVNDDPIKDYNSDQALIGALYKLSSGIFIMVVPEGNDNYNILLFK